MVALLTGWLVAVVLGPAVMAGLPALLSAPAAGSTISRLEAMEEWTRSLAGVLTVGIGFEEALVATLRSAPDPIRPEVARLVARLGPGGRPRMRCALSPTIWMMRPGIWSPPI